MFTARRLPFSGSFARITLRLLATAVTLASPALAEPSPPTPTHPADRPNVLILVADDLGYADLGVQGCTDIPTPHLDSIAARGIRFTAGTVAAPVCSPSRAGLITGRSPTRFGHEFNHPDADRAPVGMPVDQPTLADRLRSAGYATGHVGKWHLGNPSMPAFAPTSRGFDESSWFPGQRKLPPLVRVRNGVREPVEARYVDEAMADEAGGFIGRHADRPWFLYVAFLTPHEPLDVPPEVEARFSAIEDPARRRCAAMMALLDGAVGRILEALRESGQEERTLVIFLSDNGAPPGNGSRNTPFRGTKGSTWEGGLRVPFLMQWPGGLPAGKVVEAPVSALDIAPTALAAAGVERNDDDRFDGVDLLPFLAGRSSTSPHEALFWRYGSQWAIREGDWKLTTAIDREARPPVVKTSLHDLATDPGERLDLADRFPDKVRELRERWETWNASNVPALWGEDPAAGRPRRP